MRERFIRFMSGRNGNDPLNMFLLAVSLVLLVISTIFSRGFGSYLYPLVLAVLGYSYFRMLSRDVYRRSRENARYLQLKDKLASRFRLLKERWTQRKNYKFFTCPECKAVLRVPRGRGKLRIVCRKCGSSFTGKS